MTAGAPRLRAFASIHDGEREAVPALGADGLDRCRAEPRLARHHLEHTAHADDVRIGAGGGGDRAVPHDIVDHDCGSRPGEP